LFLVSWLSLVVVMICLCGPGLIRSLFSTNLILSLVAQRRVVVSFVVFVGLKCDDGEKQQAAAPADIRKTKNSVVNGSYLANKLFRNLTIITPSSGFSYFAKWRPD
jgi:hypothetical protein